MYKLGAGQKMRAHAGRFFLAAVFAIGSLIISNSADSAPKDEILPPIADAGPDQTVSIGDVVVLDGTGSFDLNDARYFYSWQFVSRPSSSAASLSDLTAAKPSFVVDKAGDFLVELVVEKILNGTKTLASVSDIVFRHLGRVVWEIPAGSSRHARGSK